MVCFDLSPISILLSLEMLLIILVNLAYINETDRILQTVWESERKNYVIPLLYAAMDPVLVLCRMHNWPHFWLPCP